MKKSLKNKHKKNIATFLAVFIFVGIVILLILGVNSYLDNSAYFKIKKVVLNGLDNKEFAQRISSRFLYENIFSLNLRKIKENLKISNPQFYDVEIIRNFPDQLTINVTERKPVAQIKQKGFFLVDSEGVIVSDISNEPFTGSLVISGFKSLPELSFGKKINLDSIKSALKLIYALKPVVPELISMIPELTPDNMEIDTTNHPSLYVFCGNLELRFYDDSLEKSIKSLEKILPSLKENIHKVKYIDLRFAEPTVSFEK